MNSRGLIKASNGFAANSALRAPAYSFDADREHQLFAHRAILVVACVLSVSAWGKCAPSQPLSNGMSQPQPNAAPQPKTTVADPVPRKIYSIGLYSIRLYAVQEVTLAKAESFLGSGTWRKHCRLTLVVSERPPYRNTTEGDFLMRQQFELDMAGTLYVNRTRGKLIYSNGQRMAWLVPRVDIESAVFWNIPTTAPKTEVGPWNPFLGKDPPPERPFRLPGWRLLESGEAVGYCTLWRK